MPVATASLSLAGSLLLLISLCRKTTGRFRTVYERLMASVSIMDISLSAAYALGAIPIPAETGFPEARGNLATCTAQGFFKQLGTASYGYMLLIMIYFVLVIRYNVREGRLRRVYEPWMQGICASYYLTNVFVGLAWQVFYTCRNGVLHWALSSIL